MRGFIRFAVLVLALAPLAAAQDDPPPEKVEKPAGPEKAVLALNSGGHTTAVQGVFFLDGGKKLVSVGSDRTIRFWDVATGAAEAVYHLPPVLGAHGLHSDNANATLSADGQRLALSVVAPAGGANWIYLFDIPSRTVTAVAKRAEGMVNRLAWSPDGKTVAATVDRAKVEFWDATAGLRLRTTSVRIANLHYLLYSPDGSRLVATALPKIHFLDPATGKPLPGVWTAPEIISALCWHKDGKSLVAKSFGGDLWVFDEAGKLTAEAKSGSRGQALTTRTPPTDEVLAGITVVDTGKVKKKTQIRTRLQKLEASEDAADEGGKSVAFCAAWSDNGVAAFGSMLGVYLWDTTGKGVVAQPLHRLTGSGRTVTAVGWSKDGTRVAWDHESPKTLSRSFDLAKLEPAAADATFTGPQFARGDLALKRAPTGPKGANSVQVFRGDEVVSKPKTGSGNPFMSWSFHGDKQVLVGSGRGVTMSETLTGNLSRIFTGASHVKAIAPRPDLKYFAAGGQGQTVHVYAPDRAAPVLSLFAGGDDWIVWTPEGYYAASPNGERLMGWLVDNGPEKLATFHPAARFRKVFYRPDVIKEVFATGSLDAALAKLGGAKPADLDKVLPPEVKIVAPTTRATTTETATITITAEATGTATHPVKSLQLLVNGRPYQPFQGTRGVRSVAQPDAGVKRETWELTLAPDKPHAVAVAADNGTTSAVTDAIEITYKPKVAPKADDTTPALHVLAIGINAYDGDLALKCAVADATKLSEALAANGKALFPRGVFTTPLLDAAADKAGILKALDELKARVKPQDVTLVFYAGHGHTEKTDGKFYLLPFGVDLDALGKTAVSEDELKEKLMAIDGRVVLVLDACHSGALKVDGLSQRRGATTDRVERSYSDEQVGIVVWVAAHGSQYAIEEGGHGLFTKALMEGLGGKAKRDSRQEIHLSLHHYVLDEVSERSQYKQRPGLYHPPSVIPYPVAKPAPDNKP